MTDALDECKAWDEWVLAQASNGHMSHAEALRVARLPRTREELLAMAEAERITDHGPDTIAAWRFRAERPRPGEQRWNDVALVRGEGGRAPFWACDCADATFRDRRCKHIHEAEILWRAEKAARPQRRAGK